MKPDWILVANAAQARLLQREPGSPMTVLQAFHHPASRLRSSELGDDARGRERTDHRAGAAPFEARVDAHRKEHLRFAGELADVLERGAQAGQYRHLHVFAGSPFLGELRAALGDATRRLLAGRHELDLSAVGLSELELRVEQALRATAEQHR